MTTRPLGVFLVLLAHILALTALINWVTKSDNKGNRIDVLPEMPKHLHPNDR